MSDQVPDEVVAPTPTEERSPAPPIDSRFMFVDVAAMRAKQLRRGALPRVPQSEATHKLERVAMEEVRRGLVEYAVPERRPTQES
jgi:DNA-directed RNA polymerase omega subunit